MSQDSVQGNEPDTTEVEDERIAVDPLRDGDRLAAEQAKKKAELDKIAKIRADNCDRAKRAKATLDSGIRIATTNAKGEREVMDDKARADEGKRLDEVIRSDCGPMPQAAPQ